MTAVAYATPWTGFLVGSPAPVVAAVTPPVLPPDPGTPSYLLMESGDYLLLESGDRIVLEA